MIQDLTMIQGYPDVMNHIKAVSDILDLSFKNEAKLCFTITFQDETFVNISQAYTKHDRSTRYWEILLQHDRAMEHLNNARQPHKHRLCTESDTEVSFKE